MKAEPNRKTKVGVVVSSAMDKSVVVSIERTVLDPIYKKYVRHKNKFMAHDEKNTCKVGDTVRIRECRPLSKRKHWCIEQVISKADVVDPNQSPLL